MTITQLIGFSDGCATIVGLTACLAHPGRTVAETYALSSQLGNIWKDKVEAMCSDDGAIINAEEVRRAFRAQLLACAKALEEAAA